jgi:succinate dehydrogenase flavin-adding protein (antitoxin of CptAB toxin-antitoxin module)
MDKAIARLNIEHYRNLLANEMDEAKRQTIARLLAEEDAKLAALENVSKKRKTTSHMGEIIRNLEKSHGS